MHTLTPAVILLSLFLPRCDVRLPKPCAAVPADMKCVPGGPVIRGTDHGAKSTRPAIRAWVDTFYMDTTEVTVKEFEACAAAGKCPYQKTNYKGFSEPDQPKVGVNWYAAKAFCEAHGKRLPTEAEFEKAIRGPNGELYAWGNEPVTCERAIYKHPKLGRGCGRKSPKEDTGATWPVKSRPVGRYGLYDINGNADEWVLDWYTFGGYAECGSDCLGVNPKGPCQGAEKCPGYDERIVKGGSWFWDPSHFAGYYRRPHDPHNRKEYHHFGFRCARDASSSLDFPIALYNHLLQAWLRILGTPAWWDVPHKGEQKEP